MACFLCNGGLELILGSIALTVVAVKNAVKEKRTRNITEIK